MNTVQANKYFPLSSRYDEQWVRKNSLGENVLYNLESLSDALELNPGMKVLDLGSGKAISAIFLAKEFNVKVWAVDSKICPTSNFKRIREMDCEESVLPLKIDARQLPFPAEYFDVIIAVDSFMYYGTDYEFTNYISQFLKPGGQLGIVDLCYHDRNSSVNNISKKGFINKDNFNFVHSLGWWHNLWNNNGKLNVTVSEIVPENSRFTIHDSRFTIHVSRFTVPSLLPHLTPARTIYLLQNKPHNILLSRDLIVRDWDVYLYKSVGRQLRAQ
ncbi:MAG: methyltransferase domain-containing protein [Ignavibacteria bacterium]|nr:methyltransferase domain-containing protein [Ignavibacteria bacterium]